MGVHVGVHRGHSILVSSLLDGGQIAACFFSCVTIDGGISHTCRVVFDTTFLAFILSYPRLEEAGSVYIAFRISPVEDGLFSLKIVNGTVVAARVQQDISLNVTGHQKK